MSSNVDRAEPVLPLPDDSALPIPIVSAEAGIITLHFGSDYVQSQMRADDPDSLALVYTRTMMAFEVFKPAPRTILQVGLGGGSIAKWCYRHHPGASITVVEINPRVIAVRDLFHIPQDDDRFQILCRDGRSYVAESSSCFDVMLVDGYGPDSLPQELCSPQFYDDCYQALTGSGLMVVNLCDKNPRSIAARIRTSFKGQVLHSTDADGNTIVFAAKGELPWPKGESPGSFQMKLRQFEKKYGMAKAIGPVG